MSDTPSLGELELRVLQMVWDQQPCTERQVSEKICADRDVARTTILKTIQRLEAKGFLKRLPGEGPVKFKAAVEQKKLVPGLIHKFVDTVLGGSPDPLVAYFADSGKLSKADLQTLKSLVEKMSSDKSP